MASKIITFPTRDQLAGSNAMSNQASPEERAKKLPEWLQELDVAWIFKEDEQRQKRRNGR
ncbi:MAG: hypothetical protein ACE37M_15970 [Henriciella sp.]